MSDIMKMLVAVYGTREGEVRLTDRQEQALQSACVWQTLGYHFSRFDFAEPTHTDAQIVSMCRGYKFIARIARGSDSPFVVTRPSDAQPPTPCLSFADAVKCANDLRCDVVTVSPGEYRKEFDAIADHWRVTILIVADAAVRVAVFKTPEGAEVSFAPHQRLALERARRWETFGYKLCGDRIGEPTFTDKEIAALIADYTGLTKIRRPDPMFQVENHPYNIYQRFGTDVPCVSIEAALDLAREFGCDVVAVPAADMESTFQHCANERGITLLVV